MSNRRYNVVFRTTVAVPGYEGVITWSTYQDREELLVQRDKHPHLKEWYEVIAEGVSDDEAVRLSKSTPLSSYLRSSIQEATSPNGEVSNKILELQLSTIMMAAEPPFRGRDGRFDDALMMAWVRRKADEQDLIICGIQIPELVNRLVAEPTWEKRIRGALEALTYPKTGAIQQEYLYVVMADVLAKSPSCFDMEPEETKD